ncbi:MAG TPA: hypothetical protein VGO58_04860 [Chitinophagaceae bacterium]|jgi:hypothetical protein|nr:hypothetical protein [Chitinophagaceae bacterium]
MKKLIKKWTIAAAMLMLAGISSAQNGKKEETAPWVSEKGYWVIETNVKTPLQHIVRFYTNEDVLVYTEKVEGIRLNPDKRKVKMKLKEVLETSVVAWEKSKIPETDKNYVTTVLK